MSVVLPIEFIEHQLTELSQEQTILRERLARVEIELEVYRDIRRRYPPSLPVADERVGPAEAVRQTARKHPNGLRRPDLRRQAKTIVRTPQDKADKVLDQTIRNLLGRDIEERDGLIYPKD